MNVFEAIRVLLRQRGEIHELAGYIADDQVQALFQRNTELVNECIDTALAALPRHHHIELLDLRADIEADRL